VCVFVGVPVEICRVCLCSVYRVAVGVFMYGEWKGFLKSLWSRHHYIVLKKNY
jgi:hypothetical protein